VEERARILQKLDNLLQDSEIELVDVETLGSSRGLIVRIYVDKPGGISVGDCARLSRAVGDHFEAEDAIPGRYVLEVSSPGVDRPLRRPHDFEKFRGETAQVSTYEKIGGRHKHRGILAGYDPVAAAVLIEDDAGESLAIPLGSIRKANLQRNPWPRKGERVGGEAEGGKRKR
jgi:ribosome maturation factor RimP